MAVIETNISDAYVGRWGAWEGVREFVQNALDASDDGFEMKVRHSGDTLKITSVGARLQKDVWLMGVSSKASGSYRGHFGEGLKLACLCLLRAGHDVKMINRDESWTPKLEGSEVFNGRTVLKVFTRVRENDCGVFTVEINGIDKEAWELMRPRFLALCPAKKSVETRYATVLLDPEFKGKVFVKGIFVQHNPQLAAGYDFKQLETDRDRKMVDSWDLRHHAGRAWEEAMTSAAVKVDVVLDLMATSAPDVQGVGDSTWGDHAVAARQALAAAFVERHGDGALPVANMAEAREVGHYGKAGVVVPESLVAALRSTNALNLDAVRKEFKNSVKKTYGWGDLTADEQATYTDVVGMVEAAAADLGYAKVEERLTVVDFGDEALNGLHESVGGVATIKIAKRLLTSFEDALRVLVHEVAHDNGGDGEKAHEAAEGKLFARIVRNARQVKVVKAPAPVAPAPVAPDALGVLADPASTEAEIAAALALLR